MEQQQQQQQDGQQQEQQLIADTLRPGLRELQNTWDCIGYEQASRTARLQTLADSLQRCLFEFISDENRERVQLEATIESRKRKVGQACRSLGQAPYFPPRGLASLQLLRHLDSHIAQFEQQIVERQSDFGQLTAEIGQLCCRLGLDAEAETAGLPTAGERPDEFIPSEQDLQQVADCCQRLRQRRDAALKSVTEFRLDIRRIAADIEYLPEDEFEAAVLADGDAVQVKLSQETLSQLQQWRLKLVKHKAMLVGTCDELREQISGMWRRLQTPEAERREFLQRHSGYRPSTLQALQAESARCQEAKRQQLPAYVRGLRRELSDLAARCFADVADEAEDDDASEEADAEATAERLERRVEELRDRYERSRELYDAVQQYQDTWAAFLEVEQRMKDPGIFSNRGGILLKTEKERRQLAKELPRVEARVSEQLQRLGAGDFRINGRSFGQHVEQLWREFRSEKEAAKFSRKLSRVGDDSAGPVGRQSRESLAKR